MASEKKINKIDLDVDVNTIVFKEEKDRLMIKTSKKKLEIPLYKVKFLQITSEFIGRSMIKIVSGGTEFYKITQMFGEVICHFATLEFMLCMIREYCKEKKKKYRGKEYEELEEIVKIAILKRMLDEWVQSDEYKNAYQMLKSLGEEFKKPLEMFWEDLQILRPLLIKDDEFVHQVDDAIQIFCEDNKKKMNQYRKKIKEKIRNNIFSVMSKLDSDEDSDADEKGKMLYDELDKYADSDEDDKKSRK